jgi:hypothetical protein
MRRLTAPLLLPCLCACYTFVPLSTPSPAPGTKVSLVLTDQGRVDAAREIGPYAMRVDGSLLRGTSADSYVVSVSEVVDIRGIHSKWTGEPVPFSRSAVANSYERRLSKPRTVAFAVGMTAAVVALIASRNLLGIGGSGDNGSGGGGGNGQ